MVFSQTPLHLAIQYDVSVDIVKILLHHGADLSIADTEGNTAIHLAIEHRRSALLKVLVTCASERGFNFDVFNYEGFTPLILACLNRSYHDAKLLLQHKADPNLKDMKSGRTALFHAAESFDGKYREGVSFQGLKLCFAVGLVELLMEYKADTKIRNFFGTSAHDAMFEVEDMPLKIKFCILGRDHQRFQSKKKSEGRAEAPMKKAKLETTPVLKKVSTSDLMFKSKRK
ncbi:Ankyrin repeat domain containing protein [Asbolus verrucosus]|uniref:Ankyrin repeat domain containing protein n=1 Tax=Asbolus verrucosus TaxID=1661398 RepID=A0A482VZ82_ASBVE|nr:Ankyrin repeat domain containing protein [Asbolus verrucosus]